MTQETSREEMAQILRRIAKLQAKAESCKAIGSMAEAEAFAAAVAKTLAAYKLDMTAVDAAKIDVDEPVGKSEGVDAFGTTKGKRTAWVQHLAHVVAEAHTCKISVMTGASTIWFWGREKDRTLASYVFVTLAQYAKRQGLKDYMAARYRGEYVGGFMAAFHTAFVRRIRERYQELARQQQQADNRYALIVKRDDAAVTRYMMGKVGGNASGLRGHRGNNASGAQAGHRAASSASLSANGIGSGSGTGGRLLRA